MNVTLDVSTVYQAYNELSLKSYKVFSDPMSNKTRLPAAACG